MCQVFTMRGSIVIHTTTVLHDLCTPLRSPAPRFPLLLLQTVVASAISSGDTTDYQTFNVGVLAKELVVIPKFRQLNQWFSISEVRNEWPVGSPFDLSEFGCELNREVNLKISLGLSTN